MNKLKSLWQNHKIEVVIVLLLYPLTYLMGCYVHKTPSIDREARVYPREGKKETGILMSISNKEVRLVDPDIIFHLDEVKRIDFFKKPDKKRELSKNEKRFLGRYSVIVGTFKGRLVFYKKRNGYLGGYLQFSNWGKGKREYLRKIRVRGKKITFTRSCSGAKCSKIGSNRAFFQKYKGSLKGKDIYGTYGGNLSSGRWRALD